MSEINKTENTATAGFCQKCGVTVEGDRSHCPICGKCVDEDKVGKPREFKFFPRYIKWKKDRNNVMLILTALLVAVNIVLMSIELIITKGRLNLFWYFFTGSILVFVTVLWPLVNRYSFLTKSVIAVTALSLFVLFVDLYVKYEHPDVFFGWAPSIVIPMVLMAYAIIVGFTMLLRGYYKRSALYPNFYIAVVSTALFFCNAYLDVLSERPLWPSIVVLSVSWAFFLSLFLFRYKKIWKGIKKDFHV